MLKIEAVGAVYIAERMFVQSTDAYRIAFSGNSSLAFALAIGSWTGFDIGFNEVSRVILDELMAVLCQIDGSVQEKLVKAFFNANQRLADDFYQTDDFFQPGGTAICGIIEENCVYLAWVGGHEAYHIRDAKILSKTVGHTMERIHPKIAEQNPAIRRVTMRSLGAERPPDTHPPEILEGWLLEPKDCVVISTSYVWDVLDIVELINPKDTQQSAETLIKEAAKKYRDDLFGLHGLGTIVIYAK